MKISVIIAILNSHEVVRRQIEHFCKMDLSNEVEFIFVDDGSNPPLDFPDCRLRNFRISYTNDKRPWTQGLARNIGASNARGEYLLFTDIDHIITKEAINDSLAFIGDKLIFPRHYGILDKNGEIICDEKSMLEFGLHPERVKTHRGYLCAGIHGNTYLIRKKIFDMIGGYDHRYCESGFHVGGKYASEESKFNHKYDNEVSKGNAKWQEVGSKIYFYPVGKFRTDNDTNPFGLFHGLSLEQIPQPMLR